MITLTDRAIALADSLAAKTVATEVTELTIRALVREVDRLNGRIDVLTAANQPDTDNQPPGATK